MIVGLACLALAGSAAAAGKDRVAIILYPGAQGPAYVHASNLVLNGKDEVYVCAADIPIDAKSYKKLPRLKLAGTQELERHPDGVITMKHAGGRACVVPSNLKLDKNRSYRPAELANMAVLQGRFLGRSTNGDSTVPAAFPPKTLIYFADKPDVELSEYLRAAREKTIPLWTEFLRVYGGGSHAIPARQALAALIVAEAEKEYQAFVNSSSGPEPDFVRLNNALVRAGEALRLVPRLAKADQVVSDARARLLAGVAQARDAANTFQKALNDQTPGYRHLLSARKHLQQVQSVDAGTAGAAQLHAEVEAHVQALESAQASGERLLAAKRFDDAYAAVARYRAFADELPRVSAVIDGAFAYRAGRAREASAASDWQTAIDEYQRALRFKPDAPTAAALKEAETQWHTVQTRQGAEAALASSRTLSAAKQFFDAYVLLRDLPDEQRALVAEEMELLRKPYSAELLKLADALIRLHVPIRGRANEDGARTAQQYLAEATSILDDGLVQVKLDLLNERIGEYYLAQSEKQFGKPRGLGSGLGWMFLQEARRFKSDLPTLRDRISKFSPQYDTRARLSVVVRVRDHTSRRDSLGYADQVADTIAAGLEAAHLPGVRVVGRQGSSAAEAAATADAVLPNVLLTGDILHHRVDRNIQTEALASRYRSGRRDVANPAWKAARDQYDGLREELKRAHEVHAYRAATLNKKQREEAEKALAELNTRVNASKKAMDALPETLSEDVILPYNYTRRKVNLNAVVEIVFRLSDPEAEGMSEVGTVKVEHPASYAILEAVKPEDVDGVVTSGTVLDEIQILAEAERKAQLALVDEVIRKMKAVPGKILEDARNRARREDAEGAAERYILYLNSTPSDLTREREEAVSFLKRQFNLTLEAAAGEAAKL